MCKVLRTHVLERFSMVLEQGCSFNWGIAVAFHRVSQITFLRANVKACLHIGNAVFASQAGVLKTDPQ
jgi:hypothetical protein